MKQCIYCGKEFPDEAVTCDLDGQPVREKAQPSKVPSVAIPPRALISVVLFAVLSMFSGIGVAWIAIATIANQMNKQSGAHHSAIDGGPGDSFVAHSIPLLILGGVVGCVIGAVGKWISVKRKLKGAQGIGANGRKPLT
jgi:hypothetical protein